VSGTPPIVHAVIVGLLGAIAIYAGATWMKASRASAVRPVHIRVAPDCQTPERHHEFRVRELSGLLMEIAVRRRAVPCVWA